MLEGGQRGMASPVGSWEMVLAGSLWSKIAFPREKEAAVIKAQCGWVFFPHDWMRKDTPTEKLQKELDRKVYSECEPPKLSNRLSQL